MAAARLGRLSRARDAASRASVPRYRASQTHPHTSTRSPLPSTPCSTLPGFGVFAGFCVSPEATQHPPRQSAHAEEPTWRAPQSSSSGSTTDKQDSSPASAKRQRPLHLNELISVPSPRVPWKRPSQPCPVPARVPPTSLLHSRPIASSLQLPPPSRPQFLYHHNFLTSSPDVCFSSHLVFFTTSPYPYHPHPPRHGFLHLYPR
jgi:hypothetical protein